MKDELNAATIKAKHPNGVEDTLIKAYCDALVTGTFPSGQVLRQVLTEIGYHRKITQNAGGVLVYMWDIQTPA
tara:strand:+ start:1350 stop:1568 length:219 start_codon:yes stop_codon:yes gene_type:complete